MTQTATAKTPTAPVAVDYGAALINWLATVDEADHKQVRADTVDSHEGRQVFVKAYVEGKPELGSVEMPRITYIKTLFEQDWHRGVIQKSFTGDVAYQIVFAATKGQTNQHHAEGKSAGQSGAGRVGKTYSIEINGVEQEMTRKELFSHLIQVGGLDRGGVVKFMKEQYDEEITYPAVYAATKELDLPDSRKKEKVAEAPVASSEDKATAKAAKKNGKKKAEASSEPAAANPADDNENAQSNDQLSL